MLCLPCFKSASLNLLLERDLNFLGRYSFWFTLGCYFIGRNRNTMKKKRKPEAVLVSAKEVVWKQTARKLCVCVCVCVCVCFVNGLQDEITKHGK